VPTSSTPHSLLARLKLGDDDAWRRLDAVYAPLFRAWLRPRGLQPADLDDLIQNVLTVVHRRLPDFAHNGRTGAFRAWLRAVAVNALREHHRAGRRHPALGQLLDDLADPESELSRRWDAEHDRHVLRGLMAAVRADVEPTTWAVFAGTALDGRPAAEVAADLGMTPAAVRVARCRVLARLRAEAAGFVDEV
jgi:RNA polymerase sigma-70 factor, ECF subfamily